MKRGERRRESDWETEAEAVASLSGHQGSSCTWQGALFPDSLASAGRAGQGPPRKAFLKRFSFRANSAPPSSREVSKVSLAQMRCRCFSFQFGYRGAARRQRRRAILQRSGPRFPFRPPTFASCSYLIMIFFFNLSQ